MYTDFHDQNGNPVAASVVLEAIKNPIIKHSVSVGITENEGSAPITFFTEEGIIRNSLIFTNSCASDGIKLGSVNIGMAKMTVSNDKFRSIREPSFFINKLISPIFDLDIDENTRVTVMGGDYWIKEVEQLTEGVRLTCYDSMCKLDEPFTLGTITGTPYQIFTQAATACGLTVSTTQAEMEALPNGTRTFTLHSDNDCKTWRDVLSYLSMLMGCFVTIGRHVYQVAALPGIEVRPFGNGKESFCDTVTDVHRYKGAKFSIFDTAYTALKLKAIVTDGDGTTKADFTYTDNTIATTGQAIDLGYNPFLQADTPESDLTQTQKDILHDLLVQVAKYQYTPMQISLPVGFIYDLGDVIKCTGGLANTGFAGGPKGDAYCCILGYTYTYGKEFRIKTTGNSASITGAQSSSGAGIVPGTAGGGGGSHINYGINPPSGGIDGDVYFQNDNTAIIDIWQKVNGRWIRFIKGDIEYHGEIPYMTSNTTPSGEASASSIFRERFEAYKAFNGMSADLRTMENGWLASASDSAPWLMYEFEAPVVFNRIKIETANNSTTITRLVWIEGSSDGITWENALVANNNVELKFEYNSYNTYEFVLNGNTYSYIKIRGNAPFYGGIGDYACTFSQVQVSSRE